MKTPIAHLVLVLAFVAAPVGAENIRGKVVGITDGDTLTLLDANEAQHTAYQLSAYFAELDAEDEEKFAEAE